MAGSFRQYETRCAQEDFEREKRISKQHFEVHVCVGMCMCVGGWRVVCVCVCVCVCACGGGWVCVCVGGVCLPLYHCREHALQNFTL